MTKMFLGKKLPNVFFAANDVNKTITAIEVLDVVQEKVTGRYIAITASGKRRYTEPKYSAFPLCKTIRDAEKRQ